MAAPRPDTVENIQALRGIAALLVVCAHIKFPIQVLDPVAANEALIHSGHGAMGVDLFFIISGYVICLTACKHHNQALDFLLARIARVSPLYLVYVLFFLLSKAVFMHAYNSWRSIWNGIFYLPIFDWKIFSVPPGGAGWSLSFEMLFYVTFALLLHFSTPKKAAFFLPVLFVLGTPLMALYHGDWYFPRFMFHPFVLDFAFGCIVFNTQTWVSRRLAGGLLTVGILFTLAFSRHTGDLLAFFPTLLSYRLDLAWLRVLLWGLPTAFIVAGLVGLERHRGYILPKALVWLGGISYSLYLSQQLSMQLFAEAGRRIGLHSLVLILPLLFATCIFNAWLCWKWIERPLTAQAQRWARTFIAPGAASRHAGADRGGA
jgi:peptidoglycan/LPS O-acetylase OafA/YrhL